MIDLLMHPLPGGHWVIMLAMVRVLSVVAALLALRHVRADWRANPVANTVLLVGLAMLAGAQMVGAWGMGKPTAVTPTAFAFVANAGATIVCLGIYLWGVVQIRRA